MEYDEIVFEFRKAINEWKRTNLFPKLNNETDAESIDRRIEEAHTLFRTLMTKIGIKERALSQEKGVTSGGGDEERILEKLGPEESWDQSLLNRVRSSLLTDLWEYPMTFNTTLINQFKDSTNYPIFE